MARCWQVSLTNHLLILYFYCSAQLHFVLTNIRKIFGIKTKYRALQCFDQYAARCMHCQSQSDNPFEKADLATRNYEVLLAALAASTPHFSQISTVLPCQFTRILVSFQTHVTAVKPGLFMPHSARALPRFFFDKFNLALYSNWIIVSTVLFTLCDVSYWVGPYMRVVPILAFLSPGRSDVKECKVCSTFCRAFCAILVQDVLPFVNCLRMARMDRAVSGLSVNVFCEGACQWNYFHIFVQGMAIDEVFLTCSVCVMSLSHVHKTLRNYFLSCLVGMPE